MATSVERHLAPHPWPSNAPPKSFDMFSPGNKRRSGSGSGSDSDSDSDDDIPPDWRSLYQPRLEVVEPPVHDPRDEATSDAWVRRHPALVRLTGKHPFNSEPPVPRLMSHGFITPAPLHYVRNHGAVPKADWSTWTVEVTGLVRRPARLTMERLATEFEAVELPVTLVCAGNRRKEQNMVRQTVGFNWGPGAVSTSVWRGARLRDVLRRCGVMGAAAGAANVCFEGAEDLPGGGGCKYGTSLRREVAMDPARDVILAYMQNGEPLAPDHGFPVRVIVPGFIGGRMVKWLKRIVVASSESESYYHYRDNRVLPSHVDAELANAEAWWYKPEYMINELNINSVITTPGHDEVLPINSLTTQRPYTIKGYAYSDYPTDVALPTAKIGRNKVTGLNWSFISKKSLIDPGFGSYSIQVGTDGALHLTSRMPPYVAYWNWPSGRLAELVQALNGLMDWDPRTKGLIIPTFQENDQEVYFSYNITDESASVFAEIGISGQLKLNVWSRGKQSWETVYAQSSDFCTAYAVCGPFTVCNGNAGPSFCDCMETFSQKSPLDWDLGDRTGGCTRNTPLDCVVGSNNESKRGSTDVFHSISQVMLPYDERRIEDAATQNDCAQACLSDCSCNAYSYNNSKCSVWQGELLNVNMYDGIGIFSKDVLYLRLAARDFESLRENKKRIPRVLISASIASFGFLMLLVLLMVWIGNRFKWFSVPIHGIQSGGGIVAFRYTDLGRATKDFSEMLGSGGFGSVFKGVLGQSTAIAVKRLDGARQGEKQFRAEVSSIGLIQHINLVKLIGFCCEGDKRLLVYEHMSNGSLDTHLFKSNTTILNWSTRYQIAIGVARGLCYLHQSCRECIIHCDIKPENILLNASFVPKIADFGMAAFVGREFSRVLTTFRGTVGYLAPEWLSGVAITPKVDVYSFGMVLLEIISGKRNTPEMCSKSSYDADYFPVQAISKLHEGDLQSLVDPQLQGEVNFEEAERVCKVAFWCIQDNESDRLTMGEVVRALEGLQELDMPPMPRLLAAITERSDSV